MDRIGRGPQRILRGKRFGRDGVGEDAADAARVERRDQRRLVDRGAAADVDDPGGGLHRRKLGGADHVGRSRASRGAESMIQSNSPSRARHSPGPSVPSAPLRVTGTTVAPNAAIRAPISRPIVP